MNLILLGPQGSGKGTQAELLAKKYELQHLEMGRILRSISVSDNQYAKIVAETMNSGALVPDEYTRLIAWDFVSKHQPKTSGFIFEGYPRTVSQYEQVKEMFATFGKQVDMVINIEISDQESIRRLSARRTCIKCGRVYNTITNPSKIENVCDACAGELIQRQDDTPEAIVKRLKIYREQTHPVFEMAKAEGVGFEVNGELSIESVLQEIESTLREKKLIV